MVGDREPLHWLVVFKFDSDDVPRSVGLFRVLRPDYLSTRDRHSAAVVVLVRGSAHGYASAEATH